MPTLIVFDSVHGNTEKVAQAIGDALAGEVSARHVSEVSAAEAEAIDLLIVGSPTHGGWFTEAMKDWLGELRAADLQGIRAAVFDTPTPPRILSRIFAWAAPRIAERPEKTGAELVGKPRGFVVEGVKGPLQEGELERAADWAQEIVASIA